MRREVDSLPPWLHEPLSRGASRRTATAEVLSAAHYDGRGLPKRSRLAALVGDPEGCPAVCDDQHAVLLCLARFRTFLRAVGLGVGLDPKSGDEGQLVETQGISMHTSVLW